MKAIVDKDLCIGCSLCVEICPAVFVMNDDSKAEPKISEIPKAQEEKTKEAAASCPVNAIVVKG
jgi:ferredoxin